MRAAPLIAATVGGLAVYAVLARASGPIDVTVPLGGNAFVLQQNSGFYMGYPTSSDRPEATGGARGNVNADLHLGVIALSCDDGYLDLRSTVDVIQSGRLFCPVSDGAAEVGAVKMRIDSTGAWDRVEDHMQSPRRAEVYGTTVGAAFAYLTRTEMRGTVLRVPLYAWRNEDGIGLRLNAARHAHAGAVPSYEIEFAWTPPCLNAELARRLKADPQDRVADDATRAQMMQTYVAESCPPIPH